MKTFQTLTIRNLDDKHKQDIVRIMNDISDYYNLATGQAIFEKAIIQYDCLKDKLAQEKESRKIESDNHSKKIRELEAQVSKLQNVVGKWNQFNDALLAI